MTEKDPTWNPDQEPVKQRNLTEKKLGRPRMPIYYSYFRILLIIKLEVAQDDSLLICTLALATSIRIGARRRN
jgi:hypothetical protein